MDFTEFGAIAGVVIAASVPVIGYLRSIAKTSATYDARLTALETKVGPFWAMLEQQLPKILHSPHTPELDSLIYKWTGGEITLDGMKRMADLLADEIQKRIKSGGGDGKLWALTLFVSVVKSKIQEFGHSKTSNP